MEPYKFSLIIPAFNEEILITKTLATLFRDGNLINAEVVVICNGCKDQTYLKANTFFKDNYLSLKQKEIDCRVLETSRASKTNALNIGMNNTHGLIKVLLDADIEISGKDVNILINELQNENLKAISPKAKFSFENSNFVVRQYYKVASKSHYNINMRLSNVIALSAEGVKQISPLPDVIADDEYIRRQFKHNECAVSQCCSLTFVCAKTLTSLLQVLTRVERGNIQLNSHYSASTTKLRKGYGKLSVLNFSIFTLIKALVKARAQFQFFQGKINQWERDESNR